MKIRTAAALALAACMPMGCNYDSGWNADSGPTRVEGVEGGAIEQQAAVTVRMTDQMTFEPRTVQIRPGQTVRWVNTSGEVHTVTADPAMATDHRNARLPLGASPFDSRDISEGRTFTHTFTEPGMYRYFCKPHEKMRMVGEVIVSDE